MICATHQSGLRLAEMARKRKQLLNQTAGWDVLIV
jgi:hypothetical protein